jgi:hypothetical protein
LLQGEDAYTIIRNHKIFNVWGLSAKVHFGYEIFEDIVCISRKEFGLPEGVVVYGNCNGHWKLDKETFDMWLEVYLKNHKIKHSYFTKNLYRFLSLFLNRFYL